VNQELIFTTLNSFLGKIWQKPPIHSALKKDGKPLYEYARAGIEIEVPSREVTIHKFEITSIELPKIEFLIQCTKGTYIRSIANDFGIAMNTGSYLSSLRRTKIGTLRVENSIGIEQWLP
jgi:tRNA pseudouridine55 synthase